MGSCGRWLMAIALVLTAACGSTAVSTRAVNSAEGAALDANVATSRDGIPTGSAATTLPSASGTTAATVPADGTSDAATSSASSAGAAPAKVGEGTRGIEDDTIAVGIGTIDLTKLASTFAPGYDTGSHSVEEQIRAIVDWMNARGGIAGRQIVPHFHEFPVQDLLDPSAAQRREQATCDDFTLDRPSFAAIPVVSASGVFNSCAAKRGLVSIEVTNVGENVDRERYPEIGAVWFRPSWLTGERRETVVVRQLTRRGFFDEASMRIGLLVDDSPTGRRMGEVMQRALGEIDRDPDEVVIYSGTDDGSSAVLRFRSADVTHVIWSGCVSCGGTAQTNFMRVADSQGYHPVYALSTDLAILNITNLGAPRDQLANSVAFGWNPEWDAVQPPSRPPTGPPLSPAEADCRAAAAEAGIPFPFGMYCEGLFFLQRVLESAPELSPHGFLATVESLGTSYVPVTTFATQLGPQRHDGAASVRDLRFDESCDCWSYVGTVLPMEG
jgi:hypothetical protein